MAEKVSAPLFIREGHCPICDLPSKFIAWGEHLRDMYLCARCRSIPRERALMHAINTFFPKWRDLTIHESSPAPRGVSTKLKSQCKNYIETQYHSDVPEGENHSVDGWRCENLERQTFENEIFDLVITQDVFEHVFDAAAAIKDIARTLKKGGAHIGTTPLVRGAKPTIRCAEKSPAGEIIYHVPADYHINPVDQQGSLVTYWWGYDIAFLFSRSAPVDTLITFNEIPQMGIEGPLTEVVVSFRR